MTGNSKISIYPDMRQTATHYRITVAGALERIRNGHKRKECEEIRALLSIDPKKATDLKLKLSAVTFSGDFSERKDEKLIQHSGFVVIDFDKCDARAKKAELAKDPMIYACWVSPSGNGVKALVRIADPSQHKAHYAAISRIYPQSDKQNSNVSRLCFESYDPELYLNESADVFRDIVVHESFKITDRNRNEYDIYEKLKTWLEKKGHAFVTGERNIYLFKLASACARFGLDLDLCEQFLFSDHLSPLSDFDGRELRRTVESAYNANKNRFGSEYFESEKVLSRETRKEVNPDIYDITLKPTDVIFGEDVAEDAREIFLNGYKSLSGIGWPAFDNLFKFKTQEITVLSGIGNHGKSAFSAQLELIKSLHDGTKWAMFVPEDFPAQDYFHGLCEVLIGCDCTPQSGERVPIDLFDSAYRFVSEHFFFIYPTEVSPTPEYVKEKFLELIVKKGVKGVKIDPFNQMENDTSADDNRDDRFLSRILASYRRFAQQNHLYFLIVCHPTKNLKKLADGNYECPDVFQLAQGAMWNNKSDNILIYHRPFYNTDPDSTLCEFHRKKIKRQKIVGRPGMTEMEYIRRKRRFYINNTNPLDNRLFNPYNFVSIQEDQPYVYDPNGPPPF